MKTKWKFIEPTLMEVWTDKSLKHNKVVISIHESGACIALVYNHEIKKWESGEKVRTYHWNHSAEIKAPTLRPYTPEEFEKELINRSWVKRIGSNYCHSIHSFCLDFVGINNFDYDFEELKNKFTWLDGSPMGVEE